MSTDNKNYSHHFFFFFFSLSLDKDINFSTCERGDKGLADQRCSAIYRYMPLCYAIFSSRDYFDRSGLFLIINYGSYAAMLRYKLEKLISNRSNRQEIYRNEIDIQLWRCSIVFSILSILLLPMNNLRKSRSSTRWIFRLPWISITCRDLEQRQLFL